MCIPEDIPYFVTMVMNFMVPKTWEKFSESDKVSGTE